MNKKETLGKSIYYALSGIKQCLSVERNLMIHFAVMIIVIISGWFFQITLDEWIVCIILFGFVIALELVNTAIENTVDICSPEINPKAKVAKDTAAGAVLIAVIAAVIIGIIIFLPKIISLFA